MKLIFLGITEEDGQKNNKLISIIIRGKNESNGLKFLLKQLNNKQLKIMK